MPSVRDSTVGTGQQSRSLRLFLLAATSTPFLLVLEPVRHVASVRTTAAVVAVGVTAGVGMKLLLGWSDSGQQGVSRLPAVVVTVSSTICVTGLLWILLPEGIFRTVPQFCLAFVWSFSSVSVVQSIILPRVTGLIQR